MYSVIKIKDLMSLEKILLMINSKYKFELSFANAYKLYLYLMDVGKITNYFFTIQDEFHSKYGDVEKLQEYHDKILQEEIAFEYRNIIKFIKEVQGSFEDNELNKVINDIKFWG